MGYAETIMMVRDADSSTEILFEREPGQSEDGAVLEMRVTLNYDGPPSTQHHGCVRLRPEYLHVLARWLGEHSAEVLFKEREADDGATDTPSP